MFFMKSYSSYILSHCCMAEYECDCVITKPCVLLDAFIDELAGGIAFTFCQILNCKAI